LSQTFDKCSKLWDNTNGCCGSNKHFEVDLEVVCQPDQKTQPTPVSGIAVSGLRLDKLEITEKIIGIKIDVADITGAISSAVTGVLRQYVTSDAFLPGPNSTKLTLLQWVNSNAQAKAVMGSVCTPPGV
jgi:hypothetical protein